MILFSSFMFLLFRLGNVLRIKKTRLDDGGVYQCFASTALANSSVASTKLIVLKGIVICINSVTTFQQRISSFCVFVLYSAFVKFSLASTELVT